MCVCVCVCLCVCVCVCVCASHKSTVVNVYRLKFLSDDKNTVIKRRIMKMKFSIIVHRTLYMPHPNVCRPSVCLGLCGRRLFVFPCFMGDLLRGTPRDMNGMDS